MNTDKSYAEGFDCGINWEKNFAGRGEKPGGPWYDRRGGSTPDREAENKAWLRGWNDGRASLMVAK